MAYEQRGERDYGGGGGGGGAGAGANAAHEGGYGRGRGKRTFFPQRTVPIFAPLFRFSVEVPLWSLWIVPVTTFAAKWLPSLSHCPFFSLFVQNFKSSIFYGRLSLTSTLAQFYHGCAVFCICTQWTCSR